MPRSDPQRAKRSRIVVGLLVVLIALLTWRVLTYEPFATSRKLGEELAAARKEGLATAFGELPSDKASAAGNAASIYRPVIAESNGKTWESIADVVIAVRTHEPKEVAKAKAARPRIEPVVREFEKGTALPHLDFAHDPSLGYRTAFADEQVLASLGTVLRWDAEEALGKGDVETAFVKAQELARLARQLSDEPYLAVVGLRAHVLSDLFAILEPIVFRHGRLPSIRSRVRQVSAEVGPTPNYRTILARELPSVLASVDRADARAWKMTAPSFALFDKVASSAKFPVFRDAFKVRLIQFWRRAYAKLPPNSADLFGVQTALYDAQAAQEDKTEFSYTLGKLLYDEYASIVSAFNGSEARMMLIGTALDWIEGKHNLPVDPDSGKPLLHKALKDGEVLYSVGPDGKDDGASMRRGAGGMPIDIVVRLPKS